MSTARGARALRASSASLQKGVGLSSPRLPLRPVEQFTKLHPLPVAAIEASPSPNLRSALGAARTFLTRRSTSFWATSYPPQEAPSTVPALPPPLPSPSAVTPPHDDEGGDGNGKDNDQRRIRKEKYLDSLMDKASEMGLQCSILDSQGHWTVEEGTYKKMDLCREFDLDPRDLRKLDSLAPSLVPVILTRRSCILISILNIRALIKADRVIIFNAPGTQDDEDIRRFKIHLQANIRSGLQHNPRENECEDELGLSYEHRALESILVFTANGLEEEMGFIRSLVATLLENFEHDINRENLRRLLIYSRRLAGFQNRAKYIKSAFDELLDSDEDLSAMYVTDRIHGHPRAIHDHEQLELLLESFTKQVEEIISEIDTTVTNMQSTQEVAELMLDSGRNALLALDIKVSMATLGIGSSALVAGLFGMNLPTQLEENPYAFYVATGGAAFLALIVYGYSARVLRRVRHVSLVGRPSSLPESVREAKERFVRERMEQVEHLKALEDAARQRAQTLASQREAALANRTGAAAAAAAVSAASQAARPIADYDTRWRLVRRELRSRTSWWDRIFHPSKFRYTLLGLRPTKPNRSSTAIGVNPSSTARRLPTDPAYKVGGRPRSTPPKTTPTLNRSTRTTP